MKVDKWSKVQHPFDPEFREGWLGFSIYVFFTNILDILVKVNYNEDVFVTIVRYVWSQKDNQSDKLTSK